MERIEKLSLLMLTLILMFSTLANAPTAVEAASPEKGPRTEDLVIYYYGNVTSAYVALKAGEIDIIGYELTPDLFEDAINDVNIVLAPVADSGMYQFDINNNCTIATYPGIRSPTNYQGFRQALAWLTDKEYVIEEACEGFAERIDQPIAAPYKGWRNESMWYPNYPYEYNPVAAAATLDAEGFVQGETPNPYYDAAFPGSAEYIRIYPAGHSKAGQDLDDLEVCVRTDDTRRLQAGRLTYQNMRKHGIPVNALEADMAGLYDKVMGAFDYHMYTGGWSVGRFPPITLHGLYHSDFTYSYGPNYVTGNGTHPYLDTLLDFCRYPASYNEAINYTKIAAGYMTEICVNIPLFSAKSFWPWNKNLIGVVNMAGSGPENSYTFMNAYKADGSAIRFGLKGAPVSMNIIYSYWYYDYPNLDGMNLYGGIDVPPYDLSADQAGWLLDWETGTWIDPDNGETKTKITKYLRGDAYFGEPVTGYRKANVNASHFFFSAWYIFQGPSHFCSSTFDSLHHIDIVDTQQVDMYFDFLSYWNTYYAIGPMLPMDTWMQQPTLGSQSTETFVEGINLTTPGPVNLSGRPVWINSVTVNGTHLNMFSEYNIVGGVWIPCDSKGELEVFVNLTAKAIVVVDYWQYGAGSGYTPGNLPWQTIFEGAGMYYAMAFTPGIGGNLTLKRNPYYWMEAPPLGEIDFVWKWESGPKPRNGSHKIDIYDIVIAAGAYGSQGTGVPDRNWFPGADVAPSGGQVDIYDIVTIVGKYGEEWGHTP